MLNRKQKDFLRKYSQQHEILKFNIGKDTIDRNVLSTLRNALTKHEIIKISFLKSALDNKDKQELILDIVSALNVELINSVGNVITVFKANTKLKNSIKLELDKMQN